MVHSPDRHRLRTLRACKPHQRREIIQPTGASRSAQGATLTIEAQSAGDPIPAQCEVIEVHVTELKQLFNAIDPSPFREKDLDPKAEDFIVSWARDVHGDARLALLVYLDRQAGLADEAAILRDAIREYFG